MSNEINVELSVVNSPLINAEITIENDSSPPTTVDVSLNSPLTVEFDMNVPNVLDAANKAQEVYNRLNSMQLIKEATIVDGNIVLTGQNDNDVVLELHYTHNQMSPSKVWTITHNLKKKPSVTVIDSAGTVVYGAVQYDSLDTITVYFAGAFSGTALLN